MNQKADHPHQAAVHLVKALKCCQDCSESQEFDLTQIRQLQYRKSILAQQLRQVSIRGQSIQHLESQIRQLNELVTRLQQQNSRIEQQGLNRIQSAHEEREMFQNQQMSQIVTELELEIQQNRSMKKQMEMLMERVKYLNRVNNELVYNFSNL